MRQNINAIINDDNLLELQAFMLDTMWSAEMTLDWFCDRFTLMHMKHFTGVNYEHPTS